jgi:multicomponent Na+:H+ antiporter subunit A
VRDTDHGAACGPTYLWVAAFPLAAFLGLVWGLVHHPLPWQAELPWAPSLGLTLSIYVDGLSVQLLVLITGIGTLVFVYASGYLAHEPYRGRLYLLLVLFLLAMVGAVTADNLLALFLFWELTSLLSFLLVGFHHELERSRASARQALLVTMGGGLCLLAGILLLGEMAGSFSLRAVLERAAALREDPRLLVALGLLLVGAFTKSAQFPFHFWLPNAMAAPTPVSAFLHSATLVKLGVYLLARLDPAFNDLLAWELTLVAVGTLTAVWAAVLVLGERDLKRILAWSTVSALGTLTLLVGLPNPGAGLAFAAFLFAHALYKAPLFFVAGNIDHATGTRLIDHLMGLRRAMPWTMAAAVIAGVSMAGLPLSFGYLAKDAVSAAKAEAGLLAAATYASVFVGAIAVAVAAVATVRVFGGPPEAPPGRVHEVSWRMVLPPLAIAAVALAFGLWPERVDPLLWEAGRSIAPHLTGAVPAAEAAIAPALTTTEVTLAIGVLLFLGWDRLHHALRHLPWLDRLGPSAAFEGALKALARLAAWQTRRLQGGRLAGYMRLTLAALLAGGALAWAVTEPAGAVTWDWPAQGWAWAIALALVSMGAIASVTLRDRLALLMASGLVGYGSAALFLFTGAPDLAFTQFAVETVLVVVATVALPHYRPAPDPAVFAEPRLSNALLALAAGAGVLALLLHLFGLPFEPGLSAWMADASVPQAQGRNVVNVILVDFRALDTLGEIAVVAFSLLAALPLLASLRRAGREG